MLTITDLFPSPRLVLPYRCGEVADGSVTIASLVGPSSGADYGCARVAVSVGGMIVEERQDRLSPTGVMQSRRTPLNRRR